MMFRTILVPLDGSAAAERALPVAATLAGRGGARLLLVQVADALVLAGEDPSEAEALAVAEAREYLARVAERIAGQGVAVETAAPFGPPAEEILAESRLRAADLVVLTTHGQTGPGRSLYGGVAEAVLAHSPVPVLLLQRWQETRLEERIAAGARLLVPLDGSAFAEAALPVASELARQVGGELVLLRAVPAAGLIVGDAEAGVPAIDAARDGERPEAEGRPSATRPAGDRAEAERYLARVAERMAAEVGRRPAVEARLGEPVRVIVDTARERQADLVVMSTHGRTGLSRVAFGSVAAGVLRHASAPLLLVRPTDMMTPTLLPIADATASPREAEPAG